MYDKQDTGWENNKESTTGDILRKYDLCTDTVNMPHFWIATATLHQNKMNLAPKLLNYMILPSAGYFSHKKRNLWKYQKFLIEWIHLYFIRNDDSFINLTNLIVMDSYNRKVQGESSKCQIGAVYYKIVWPQDYKFI